MKSVNRLQEFQNEQVELTTFFCRRAGYMYPTHAGFEFDGSAGNVGIYTEDMNTFKKAGYTIMQSAGPIDPPIPVILHQERDRIDLVIAPDGKAFQVVRPSDRQANKDIEVVHMVNSPIEPEDNAPGNVVSGPFGNRQSVKSNDGTPPNAASLYMKMARVMASLEVLPERGYNKYQSYKYVTDGDLYNAVRKAMAAQGLALIVRFVGQHQEDQTFVDSNDKTKSQTMTYVDLEFVLACGDSGATVAIPWIGTTTTTHDKAIAGAITNAEKAFLKSTFIVSTGDVTEDPDSTDQNDTSTRAQSAASKKQAAQPKPQSAPAQPKASNGNGQAMAPANLIAAVKADKGIKAVGADDKEVFNTINAVWRDESLSEDETGVLGKLTQLVMDRLNIHKAERAEAKS